MAKSMHHLFLLLLSFALTDTAVDVVVVSAATTHLHFYMHDMVTAANPTAVRVVKGAAPIPNSHNSFGDLLVIDDALTEGPSPASAAVGRAQGFYLFASRTADSALLLSMNVVLMAGRYNGSTVAVLARDAILDPVRELPVVGGTGVFRGAAGYGLLRTHTVNASNDNAVLEVDMYVHV